MRRLQPPRPQPLHIQPPIIAYQRQRSSPTTVSRMAADTVAAELLRLPPGTVAHEHQVAGRIFRATSDAIGMLRETQAGSILKAAHRPACGRREIEFYERVASRTTTDTAAEELNGSAAVEDSNDVVQLRQLIPEYRGVVQIQTTDGEMVSAPAVI